MLLVWIVYIIFALFLLCSCAHLFIDALWSPAGKGMSSWLSFVMSNCEVVTFQLVSWVRCGALLYQFLIIVLFLLLVYVHLNFLSNMKVEYFNILAKETTRLSYLSQEGYKKFSKTIRLFSCIIFDMGDPFFFFLSLYTARPSFEYYRQVYFVHSGLLRLL